jgi:predicted glycosyl hydrolase (DUF1957 family)
MALTNSTLIKRGRVASEPSPEEREADELACLAEAEAEEKRQLYELARDQAKAIRAQHHALRRNRIDVLNAEVERKRMEAMRSNAPAAIVELMRRREAEDRRLAARRAEEDKLIAELRALLPTRLDSAAQ